MFLDSAGLWGGDGMGAREESKGGDTGGALGVDGQRRLLLVATGIGIRCVCVCMSVCVSVCVALC